MVVGQKGNLVDFIAKNEQIPKEEAIAKVKSFYTLGIYADEINLPISFLTDLGLEQETNSIKIPYYDNTNQEIAIRYKTRDSKYRWEKGSKSNLYGLWKLNSFTDKSYIILVKRRGKCSSIMVL